MKDKPQSKAAQAASTVAPRKTKVRTPDPVYGLLPSGATVLNCALADNAEAGIGAGKIINIIGGSSVGKTMLAETMLAEMANDPKYDEYDLILDDAEEALEMDIVGLFGKKAARRIKAPKYDEDGLPNYSNTVEQFFARVGARIEEGKKFVYCLDSLDTLTDTDELDLIDELVAKGKKLGDKGQGDAGIALPGTYGMQKAKKMSQILRGINAGLAKTGSTLVVISQTRDNVGARPGQPTKRRAGGHALDFYCSHIVWLTAVATIKAGTGDDDDSKEIIGRMVEARVTKNKLTGKVRAVKFPIYYDYGVDDIGSCVDFLVGYKVMKKTGTRIDASVLGFDSTMYKKELIAAIEDAGSEKVVELRALVGQTWTNKEQALELGRKPRFA